MRQESWHTSAFRLESRLSPSSSVQNIIGSSMGPSGEGLAIGGALTGRPVRVIDGMAHPAFKASGDITSMSQADGYIEIPAQTDIVEKGEIVEVSCSD
jgi:MoeA C-terminal region (domain IV)